MEDYEKFFGGVDSLDVSDLMKPVLVVGGGKRRKSASTVKLFSKKTTALKRKRRYSSPYSEEDSVLGSGREESATPCPTFTDLENERLGAEEEKILNELTSVVETAEALGGFSDSDDEQSDLTALDSPDAVDLTALDSPDAVDLTALDSPESIGMAGASLLDIDAQSGGYDSDLFDDELTGGKSLLDIDE